MQHDERSGILLAVAGFTSLSVGDAIVKTMAGEWSPLAVAALRFTIGAIGLSLLLWRSEGASAFRPKRGWLQLARGYCLAGATLCFFSAEQLHVAALVYYDFANRAFLAVAVCVFACFLFAFHIQLIAFHSELPDNLCAFSPNDAAVPLGFLFGITVSVFEYLGGCQVNHALRRTIW